MPSKYIEKKTPVCQPLTDLKDSSTKEKKDVQGISKKSSVQSLQRSWKKKEDTSNTQNLELQQLNYVKSIRMAESETKMARNNGNQCL